MSQGPSITDKLKSIWEDTDRRWLTTPAGAVAGIALVRALAPKRHRNWKTYTGAGVGGAAAGFGAGTIWEKQRQSMKEPKVMEIADAQTDVSPRAKAFREAYRLLHDPDREGVSPAEYQKALSQVYEYDISGKPRKGYKFFYEDPEAMELHGARMAAGDAKAPGISIVGPGRWAAAGGAGVGTGYGSYKLMESTLKKHEKTLDAVLKASDIDDKLTLIHGMSPRAANKLSKTLSSLPGTVDDLARNRVINAFVAKKRNSIGSLLKALAAGGTAASGTFTLASLPRWMTPESVVQDRLNQYLAWKNRLSALKGLLERSGPAMGTGEVKELQDAIAFVEGRMKSSYDAAKSAKMRR